MSRTHWDLMICAVLSGLLVVAVPGRAQPQSGLSDALQRSIGSVKRNDTRRNNDEATRVYEEILGDDINPTPAKRRIALRARAAAHEQIRDHARAEADYSAALALQPSDPADYLARGYFRLRTGRYGDAIADFSAGAQLEPKNPRFRYAIGRVYAALGDYSVAIEHYGQAIRIAPRDAITFLSRAEANLHLKHYAAARTDYDRAMRLGLKRPGERLFGYLGRGYVALVSEDFEAAVAEFDAVLEIDPAVVNAWLWRGYANERLGRIDQAITDYERAGMADPASIVARVSLRRVRSQEGPIVRPDFAIDERTRLAADSDHDILPRHRPQM